MPKVTWNVKGSHIDEMEPDEGFTPYDGPIPTRGVFRLKVNTIEYVKFSTGSKGLKLFVTVAELRADKKKFNGCPAWENVVDVETADFKIQQFLAAIGADSDDWDNTVITKGDESKYFVTKVGKVVINDSLFIRATVKLGHSDKGEERMELNRMLPPSDDDDAGDGTDDSNDPMGGGSSTKTDEDAPF